MMTWWTRATCADGKEAARIIWGNQASVLVGDVSPWSSLQNDGRNRSLECLRILSEAACIIAEGEVLQLAVSQDTATTENFYLKVVVSKTAALFSAAARVVLYLQPAARNRKRLKLMAAILVSLSSLSMTRWTTLGAALPWARVSAMTSAKGKLHCLSFSHSAAAASRNASSGAYVLRKGSQTNDDLLYAQKLLERHGSIAETMNRARHYGDIARDALAIFPDGPYKSALLEAVDFCVARILSPFKRPHIMPFVSIKSLPDTSKRRRTASPRGR